MKARIPAQPDPKILIYPVDFKEEKWKALDALCQKEQIRLQKVSIHQLGQRVGWLSGGPGYEEREDAFSQEPPGLDAMVFCYVPQETLYPLLQKMREEGISVDLKAMLTPNNQKWAFGDLLLELEREHQALQKG